MKKCAFCTYPADSREHIFSDWMAQMLPSSERLAFNERVVKKNEYVKYQGRTIKLTAKVVCMSCNNGWMSRLENLVKTSMDGLLFDSSPTLLTPDRTLPIPQFAFKTLVLANHKDLSTTPFFPHSLRSRFRLDLSIPRGVQIWMATRQVPAGRYFGFWKSAHGKTEKQPIYSFSNYICTWNFQNLVLQVLATKWDDKRRRATIPPLSFQQDDYWGKASVLIWPPNESNIQWPPTFYLGADTIDKFRDRWDVIKIAFPAS